MELLKQRIVSEGRVIKDSILKVDSFLNHQIDIKLYNEIGKEFKRIFNEDKVDKILTIEASGIGLACITAQYFNVPVVFAKKTLSSNLDSEIYHSRVTSFTKGLTYNIFVSKSYIKHGENILIIDDFLANGQAVLGLSDIVGQAGANLVGAGIVIEKGFQNGRKILSEKGIRIESLAIIESMKDGKLVFK
jgi:xanthine phosphoribosyltransferase